MVFRMFLIGPAHSGKTQLLTQSLFDLRLLAGGYVLLPLEGTDKLAMVSPEEAAQPSLPASAFADAAVGTSQPDAGAFCPNVLSALQAVRKKELGLLDAIGGLELNDDACRSQLMTLLHEDIPCAGAICPQRSGIDPQAYQSLMEYLRADPQTTLLPCDDSAAARDALRAWAEEVLDRAHHRKFDPLARVRYKKA